MELQEFLNIIRKRLILIIAITLLATLTSGVVSYFVIKPVYKSDISVIIGKVDNGSTTNVQASSYNDLMMYQKMVKTYAELAKSRTVADDVINKLNLNMKAEELISMISVAPKGDTEFMTITAKSKKPQEAVNIANQLAKSLKDVSLDIKKSDNVRLLDEAQLPKTPDSPKPLLNIALGFFLGLMASVGVVFVIEYLDNTVKSVEEIEKLLNVSVIGTIPLMTDNE